MTSSLFPETGGADVLSVDLGWNADTHDRTAVAYRALSGISVLSVPPERGLPEAIAELAAPSALVLLDIPIEGCAGLDSKAPYRQVDRALHRLNIPLLPSYKAGGRGVVLRDALRRKRPDLRVEESYPYAVLRVLWALRRTGRGLDLGRDSYERVSLEGAWGEWPPRYKREPNLEARRAAAVQVAGLLEAQFPRADSIRGLAEEAAAAGAGALTDLSDRIDAALGLVAAVAAAAKSPWSWRAAVSDDRGAILTIADRWLRERFASAGSLLDI